MTTIDLLPLKTAIRYIDAHPERWNQNRWGIKIEEDQACGTAFCVAGFIIHQAPGWEEIWRVVADGDLLMDRAVGPDGRPKNPDVAAREILGLYSTPERALSEREDAACLLLGAMFDGGNSRTDIQLYAVDLARELGQVWDVPLPGWANPEDTRAYRTYVGELLEEYWYWAYDEYGDED